MPATLGWIARVFSSGVMFSCPVVCAQTNAPKISKKTVVKTTPPAPKTKTTQEKPKAIEPKQEESPKKPIPTLKQAMEQAKKENDYFGCGILPQGFRDGKIWYVCSADKGGSNIPTFHRYDRTKYGDQKMVSFSPDSKKVTFAGGATETLLLSPYWVGKLRGQDLRPEVNCRFEKKTGSSYDLKCYDQVIQANVQF